MKSRDRGRFAGREAAWGAWGLLTIALALPLPLGAQEAKPPTESATGEATSAVLAFTDVNYSFISTGFRTGVRNSPFPKEPSLSGGKIMRGTLDPSGGKTNEIAFILDWDAAKLYLDLNHNLDLTDDPSGAFSAVSERNSYSRRFADVRLGRYTQFGMQPCLMDLTFYAYGRGSCNAALRSFWQGKVRLRGNDWQVGVLENQQLLVRPWSERNRHFALNGGSLEAVPLAEKVFFGNQAYRLKYSAFKDGDKARARLEFTETNPELGELRLTGQFIERLVLEGGPYAVVLDRPEGVVRVPTGSYSSPKVCLSSGEVEAALSEQERMSGEKVKVSAKKPATLVVGGPLTNSVSVSRHGRNLAMNYRLVGAGGAYELVHQDQSHPPEFAVYLGDKKLTSGKFQYG